MKKVAVVILVVMIFVAMGLLGTDELQHDQAVKQAHPEWAQFYED